MATFIFRCPTTGRNVQAWFADDRPEAGADTYETVTCTACGKIHLVNPKTRKALGVSDD